MLMLELHDKGWWYWLVTATLLTIGIAGHPVGFVLAIALTMVQLVHYAIEADSLAAFPLQVRFWYLMLLLVSLPEPMRWLFWIPTIGTWAQVLFGYCAMARLVSLFPWNRSEPFNTKLLVKTFFSRPVRGNILQGFAEPSPGGEKT